MQNVSGTQNAAILIQGEFRIVRRFDCVSWQHVGEASVEMYVSNIGCTLFRRYLRACDRTGKMRREPSEAAGCHMQHQKKNETGWPPGADNSALVGQFTFKGKLPA